MQFDPINPEFISPNCAGTADGLDDQSQPEGRLEHGPRHETL